MKAKSESEVAQLCPTLATPWTAAYQAPPSMGFSRQKYWSGVPLPSSVELDCSNGHLLLSLNIKSTSIISNFTVFPTYKMRKTIGSIS